MSVIDDNFIEEVKTKNNIVDIISSYLELKGTHDSLKGLCPFHAEKSPSFMVSEKKQFFKCFGCGEGGDVISFLMKKENLEFIDALKILAEKANINWPQEGLSNKNIELTAKRDRLFKINLEAARYFFAALWENTDNSLDYIRNRNLDDKTIKKFGIGYAKRDDSLKKYLYDMKFTDQELTDSGLFIFKGNTIKSRFFSRIMFPIFDVRGRVIAFGGRVTDSSMPKYLNSSDSPIFHKKDNLYALNVAKNNKKREIILVEGYMDVISLHQYGFDAAVASLGTALSKEQAESIRKYSKTTYICYDSDEAGEKATLRAIDILKSSGISPYIINLGKYKDPDDFILNEKADGFDMAIENASTYIRFIIDSLKKDYDISLDKDRSEFIKAASEILKNHKSASEVESEVIRISEMTGVSVKAIGTEIFGKYFSYNQFKNKLNKENEDISTVENKSSAHEMNGLLYAAHDDELQLKAVYYMLTEPLAAQKGLEILEEDDFTDAKAKEIFNKFYQNIDPEDVINTEFRGNNIKYDSIPIEQIYSLIVQIRKKSLKSKIDELTNQQIILSKGNSDSSEIVKIGLQIMELNMELKKQLDKL